MLVTRIDRRLRLVALAVIALSSRPASAQDGAAPGEEDPIHLERLIETDRNSFTFTPLTVDPGRVIGEISYTYLDVRIAEPKHSFPELITRFGISRRFELRLGWNYETGGAEDPSVGDIANFFGADMQQQLLAGGKFAITHQKGWQPASAVFAQAHVPTGGPETATQMRTGYTFGWELPNEWIFDMAFEFGTDVADGDDYLIWAPSSVVKVPFGPRKRWFTHLEYFSVISQDRAEPFNNHFLDTGLHYLMTDNIEIGGIIGLGLNPDAPPMLASFGIGVRF